MMKLFHDRLQTFTFIGLKFILKSLCFKIICFGVSIVNFEQANVACEHSITLTAFIFFRTSIA